MLTVIAVLLGVNLIATTSPAADNDAPASANGPTDPYIVELLVRNQAAWSRVWSDGQVDTFSNSTGPACDFVLAVQHPPVDHPFPVIEAVRGHDNNTDTLLLTFEDGRVDLVSSGARCTLAGIGTPSLCIGDVDRNGTVGIEDFLIVLAEWGCQ